MVKENNSAKETIDVTSVKKRKKDTPSTNASAKSQPMNSGTDIFKEAIEHEEEEARLRDSVTDFEIFCNLTQNFRTIANEVHQLKISNSPQAPAQIVEKRTEGSLLFVILKKLNRLEKYRTNQNRERLHKEKQQGDSSNLQLQNLLYEILHLRREIRKCLQFKSKDEEIDLVPVDEFYEKAPESISRPDVTRVDPHQQKLARLEWECKQRKELAALCHDLQAEKEKVAASINKKQSQLDNLAPMLKDLLNSSKPVQEALGLTTGPSPAQQKVARLLPPPLYFLFVQADALREAGDKSITVKIEGDEEEIQRMKQTVTESITPDDSDSDTQEEGRKVVKEKNSNKERIEEGNQETLSVEGREVGKRHGHRKKSRLDRMEEHRKQLLMAHPLTVVLAISLKDGQGSVSLEFSYLVKLQVVTVKPKVKLSPQIYISPVSSVTKLIDSEHILMELFPEDIGEGSPNTANYYQLKQVGIDSFDSSQLGLAYVWAQRVCGLNFAVGDAPSPSRQVSQLSLPGMVSAVKKRLRARIALCVQIQALESGQIHEVAEVRKCFPPRLIAEFNQWTSVTWAQYQALGYTQPHIANHFVTERDYFYKGALVRGSARLAMAVAIKNCYPLLPPVFALQASYENKTTQATNNDSIRDVEREVNAFFKELIEKTKSAHNLLTAQILRLITSFDILLEASSNPDFPREKVFIQSHRGRNRAWPLTQLELTDGTFHFTQR